jgi:hypothetical protein
VPDEPNYIIMEGDIMFPDFSEIEKYNHSQTYKTLLKYDLDYQID